MQSFYNHKKGCWWCVGVINGRAMLGWSTISNSRAIADCLLNGLDVTEIYQS